MKLTRDSLSISDMLAYLTSSEPIGPSYADEKVIGTRFEKMNPSREEIKRIGISVSGIHVDSLRQKLWITLGEENKYREVSITFSVWSEWIRSRRLDTVLK